MKKFRKSRSTLHSAAAFGGGGADAPPLPATAVGGVSDSMAIGGSSGGGWRRQAAANCSPRVALLSVLTLCLFLALSLSTASPLASLSATSLSSSFSLTGAAGGKVASSSKPLSSLWKEESGDTGVPPPPIPATIAGSGGGNAKPSRQQHQLQSSSQKQRRRRIFDIYDYVDNGPLPAPLTNDALGGGGGGGSANSNSNSSNSGKSDGQWPKCDLTNIKDLYAKRIARSVGASASGSSSDSDSPPSSRASSSHHSPHRAHWRLRKDFNAEAFCAQFPADGAARIRRAVRGSRDRPTSTAVLYHPSPIESSSSSPSPKQQWRWDRDVLAEETDPFLSGGGSSPSSSSAAPSSHPFTPLRARKKPARIIYGIMFGVEFDMLDVVLHEIYPVADLIAIIESTVSHSLKQKEAVLWKATGRRTFEGGDSEKDHSVPNAPHEERFARYFKPAAAFAEDTDDVLSSSQQQLPLPPHPNKIGDKIHVFSFTPRKGRSFKSGWDIEMRQRNLFHQLLPSLGAAEGDVIIGNMDMDELLPAATLLKLKYCEVDASNNEEARVDHLHQQLDVVGGEGGGGGASSDEASSLAIAAAESAAERNTPAFSIVHFRYHFGCLQEPRAGMMTDTSYIWHESLRTTKNLYIARKGLISHALPAFSSALQRRGWAGALPANSGPSSSSSSSSPPSSLPPLRFNENGPWLMDVLNNNTANAELAAKLAAEAEAAARASDTPQLRRQAAELAAVSRQWAQWDPNAAAANEALFAVGGGSSSDGSTATAHHHRHSNSVAAVAGAIDPIDALNADLNALQGAMAWHMSTFGGVELLKFKRANSPHRFVDDGSGGGADGALRATIDQCLFNDVFRGRIRLWAQNAPLLLRSADSPCRWLSPPSSGDQ